MHTQTDNLKAICPLHFFKVAGIIEGLRNSMKSVKHIIKSMKPEYGSNPYIDDATETILPICKCL